MKTPILKNILLSILFFSVLESQAVIRYVNHAATGTNNGLTWTNAYTDLHSALGIASAGDEIWVAKGTYLPTNTLDHTISFDLPSGVAVYGGFVGSEPSSYDLSLRDFDLNTTTLSGDIDGDGTVYGGNSYHVVTAINKTGNLILDGLQIAMGNAEGSPGVDRKGGGILALNITSPNSLQISNSKFTDCRALYGGGGLYLQNVNSNFQNTLFSSCYAVSTGAGIYTSLTSTTLIENCHFTGNTGSGVGNCVAAQGLLIMNRCLLEYNSSCISLIGGNPNGSVIENTTFQFNTDNSTVRIHNTDDIKFYNCNFIGNNSNRPTINIYNTTNLDFVNCSFKGNNYTSSPLGGGSVINISQQVSSCHLYNCIFWGNTSTTNLDIQNNSGIFLENCIVEGGYLGVNQINVINQNPRWIDADLNLSLNSPAINSGNNSLFTSSSLTDIDGDIRIYNGNIDMGSQENSDCGSISLVSNPTGCAQVDVSIIANLHPGATNIVVSWDWADGSPIVQNGSFYNTHRFNISNGCSFPVTVTITYNFGNNICQLTETINIQLVSPPRDPSCRICDIGELPFRIANPDLSDTENEAALNSLEIYPNPATDRVNLVGFSGNIEISIFDLDGRIQMKKNISDEMNQLDLAEFAPGMYILRTNDIYGNTVVKRFIVQ